MSPLTLTGTQRRAFETELARIQPLLARASRCAQERLLDQAFEHAGIAPARAQWYAWARAILPAHRATLATLPQDSTALRSYPVAIRRAG